MKNVADIVDAFGGNSRMAQILGKGASTVSEFKRRGAIPIEYWPKLISAAEQLSIEGIDERSLLAASIQEPAE